MTMQPHADIGHLTNTADPGWCVYCDLAMPEPPEWDWAAARQEIIVRAAEVARRCQTLRRRAERLATFRSAHAAMARATSAAAGLAARPRKDAA